MKRSNPLAIAALIVVLLPCSCIQPTEEVVTSQHSPNWRHASPEALTSARETPTPQISPETHIAAASLFESQGHFAKAVAQYQKALAKNPKYAEAHTRLGILLGKVGHHADAEEHLRKAVEIRPQSATLRNNLGFEYALQGRWKDAEAELRNAVRLEPNFKRAYVNLAMVLCKQERYQEGLEAFEEAVREADAYFNLGLMLRSARRYRDAADAFGQALDIDPGLVAAKLQLEQIADKLHPVPLPEPFAKSNDQAAPAQEATGQVVETKPIAQEPETPVAADEPIEEAAEPSQAVAITDEQTGEIDTPETTDDDASVADDVDGAAIAAETSVVETVVEEDIDQSIVEETLAANESSPDNAPDANAPETDSAAIAQAEPTAEVVEATSEIEPDGDGTPEIIETAQAEAAVVEAVTTPMPTTELITEAAEAEPPDTTVEPAPKIQLAARSEEATEPFPQFLDGDAVILWEADVEEPAIVAAEAPVMPGPDDEPNTGPGGRDLQSPESFEVVAPLGASDEDDDQTESDREPEAVAAPSSNEETLSEDWPAVNWLFDGSSAPMMQPIDSEPAGATPDVGFNPNWHVVRPGATSLRLEPFEQVEEFQPVIWEFPERER